MRDVCSGPSRRLVREDVGEGNPYLECPGTRLRASRLRVSSWRVVFQFCMILVSRTFQFVKGKKEEEER